MHINSISGLCITKLDVLDGLETVRICTAYQLDGKIIDVPPVDTDEFARCEPVYENMPGWTESTFGVTRYDALPANAKAYLARLAEAVETPIDIISTGPDRDQTIILRDPYSA